MARHTVLHHAVGTGLVPADTPLNIRVPAHPPMHKVHVTWHVHPQCRAFTDTRTVVMTAQAVLAATTGLDGDARLCTCAADNPTAYLPDLPEVDQEALIWLTNVDRARGVGAVDAVGRLRRLTRTAPTSTQPRVAAAVATALAEIRAHEPVSVRSDRHRYELLAHLVAGHQVLHRHLENRHAAGLRQLQRDPEVAELVDQIGSDPSMSAFAQRWVDTHWEGRPALVDDGLTLLARPRVWVNAYNWNSTDLGAADIAAPHRDGSWLLRAPLLAMCTVREPVTVVLVDDAHDPDVVAAAFRISRRDRIDPDLLDAVAAART